MSRLSQKFKTYKIRTVAIVSTLSLLAMLALPATASAAPATFSVSPSSKTITKGDNVTVGLYVAPSAPDGINAATAQVTFDNSRLQFVSISATCSSPWGVAPPSNGASGNTVTIDCGAYSAINSSALVSNVTFKSIATGSASIAYTAGTHAVRATDNTDVVGAKSGATITINAPPVTTPPPTNPPPKTPPTTTPKPAPKKTTPTTPSAAPATPTLESVGELTISNIAVSNITFTGATVSWSTNRTAKGTVEYGITDKLGLVASATESKTSQSVTLKNLKPGLRVFYVVKASDEKGNAESDMGAFETDGHVIKVTVVDKNGKPVKNVLITANSKTAKTDSNGAATLTGMPTGKTDIKAVLGASSATASVTIDEDPTNPNAQISKEVTITLATAAESSGSPLVWGGLLIGLVAIGIIIWLILRKRNNNSWPGATGSGMMPPSGGYGAPTGGMNPPNLPPSNSPYNSNVPMDRVQGGDPSSPGQVIAPKKP